MSRALLPDTTGPVGTVEVAAPTLEDALAKTFATYGADVQVLSACRVRRGIRGMLGTSQVVVTVVPPVSVADEPEEIHAEFAADDELDDVFAALLADADDRDESSTTRLAVTAPMRALTAGMPELTAAPAPVVLDEPAEFADEPADEFAGEPSLRSRLHQLGVPAKILGRLPVEEPDDAVKALAAAIDAVVPKPVRPSAEHPVALDGYGSEGAIAILQAAVVGVAPGRLVIDDKPARPATAKRLAEVICACVS